MKKLYLSIVFLFLSVAFAGVNAELTFGLYSNYSTINGNANYAGVNGDYSAKYNSVGVFDNVDLFINNFPLGFHFACGIGFESDLTRKVAGREDNLKDTEFSYNCFFDVGAVYAHAISQYFYICAAPSLSMLYAESEHKEGLFSRYTIDDALCFGVTGDLYVKFKYKHFVARAGCAASYYPSCSVVSSDTRYSYSSVKDTSAYNIRPYISAGVVLGFID